MPACVGVSDTEILISELSISNKDSVAFLSRIPEADRISVLQKAIEVGLFCLERGQNAGDIEFVRRQIGTMLNSVESAVTGIPERAKEALLGSIGTENGQVLSPVKSAVDEATRATQGRIQEVKDLLANDLDPSKSTTVLGQALSAIRDLLNPKMEDSVQAKIVGAVNQVALPNGSLAETVKNTVMEAIRPLQNDVTRLTQHLHGTEMVDAALAETPSKGKIYEDEVTSLLQQWAKMSGNLAEHVGADNHGGDFVIVVKDQLATAAPLRIVIEARDRENACGRQKITQDLEPKLRERQAHFGIYVSKTQAGLAKDIGDWAEGQCNSGPWLACMGDHLLAAVRFAIVQQRLKEMQKLQPDIDATDIRVKVGAIRTNLQRIKTIKGKVTNIRDAANGIENESVSLQSEIDGHLIDIERALKTRKAPESVPSVLPAQTARGVGGPAAGQSVAEA